MNKKQATEVFNKIFEPICPSCGMQELYLHPVDQRVVVCIGCGRIYHPDDVMKLERRPVRKISARRLDEIIKNQSFLLNKQKEE